MGRLPFVDCSSENGLLMPSRRDLDDGKKILQLISDLVAQCDLDAPITDTLREWERMVPFGLELAITQQAVDVVLDDHTKY